MAPGSVSGRRCRSRKIPAEVAADAPSVEVAVGADFAENEDPEADGWLNTVQHLLTQRHLFLLFPPSASSLRCVCVARYLSRGLRCPVGERIGGKVLSHHVSVWFFDSATHSRSG